MSALSSPTGEEVTSMGPDGILGNTGITETTLSWISLIVCLSIIVILAGCITILYRCFGGEGEEETGSEDGVSTVFTTEASGNSRAGSKKSQTTEAPSSNPTA